LSRAYWSTLFVLAALAAAAAAVGGFAGEMWGWIAFSAGLALALLYHARMLVRLARWLEDPLPEQLPEGRGAWGALLRALHRHEREAVRRREALADALSRFRSAAEALPDGVVILDPRNVIEWCNDTAAAHLALDPRKDIGRPIANLVREPEFVEYLGTEDLSRSRQITLQGTPFLLQLVPYAEGQKLLLSRDMTQAERVETMRRDFVANVSHELRTPLTVLAGFLETLRELNLDPQRTRDYITMMHEQAGRMRRIIDDLLTLSQLESSPPPARDQVPVQRLLERLLRDAQALSSGRHAITLEADCGADLIGSEAELASAFGNLITNAIRYTPVGGRIRVVWRADEDGARFSVEDTGIGIAPEHLPRLTERFYRVSRSRSRESGGTGLGLAIAKHALARHEATLDIRSEPGTGSCFGARFPAHRLSHDAASHHPLGAAR
jgi:two-component system phosphate regulon sensor histidine kinase PhoR